MKDERDISREDIKTKKSETYFGIFVGGIITILTVINFPYSNLFLNIIFGIIALFFMSLTISYVMDLKYIKDPDKYPTIYEIAATKRSIMDQQYNKYNLQYSFSIYSFMDKEIPNSENFQSDSPNKAWCKANIINNTLYLMRQYNNLSVEDYPSFKTIEQLRLIKIPVKDIVYYKSMGDFTVDRISTGGNHPLAGAVVGGVLGGGAGAIVGSIAGSNMKGKTFSIPNDTRRVELVFLLNNKEYSIEFNGNSLDFFDENLFKKRYIDRNERIQRLNETVQSRTLSENIPEKIRELAKLKAQGILTEEEFNSKKKMLLDKM